MVQITASFNITPENVGAFCKLLPELVTPDALAEAASPTPAPAQKAQKATTRKTKTEAPKPQADAEPEAEAPEEKADASPTKTDVRALALKLSKAGQQDALKAIFKKYGADKLSGVPESDYPALMEDLVAANG